MLILSVAVLILSTGLVFMGVAVYFVSMIGSGMDGIDDQLFGTLLMEPFVLLFRGGFITVVGGLVVMFGGGLLMLVST